MEINGQLHALATLPLGRKAFDIHRLGDWVVPKCQAQHFGGKKHFLPLQ